LQTRLLHSLYTNQFRDPRRGQADGVTQGGADEDADGAVMLFAADERSAGNVGFAILAGIYVFGNVKIGEDNFLNSVLEVSPIPRLAP
jgi:hypothetical protein